MMRCFTDACTVYHTAAKNSMIDLLLEANEYELNVRDDDGRTPLHYAALKGHLTALKVILSIGYTFIVNDQNRFYRIFSF